MRKKKNASNVVAEPPKSATATTVNVEDVKKDFLRIVFFQSKLRDGLLGSFSPDGKYKLSDEKIIKELLLIPKEFGEKIDNVIYCSTRVASRILNFKIEMEISESYCNASLSIIEIEHKLDQDIKHITKLDETVEPYSPLFKQHLFQLWKVYVDVNEYEKNDFLESYLSLQNRDFDFSKELTEILSQLYLMRMLKLLDSLGEIGEKISVDYKLMVEKILQTDPSIVQDNTRLKRILDTMILKHNAFDVILKTQEGSAILTGYTVPLKNVLENSSPVKTVENTSKKEEKKTEAKKDGKSGGSPKKKKGGKSADVTPWIFNIGKTPKMKYGGGSFSLPKASSSKEETKSGGSGASTKEEKKTEKVEEKKSSPPTQTVTDENLLKNELTEIWREAKVKNDALSNIMDESADEKNNTLSNKTSVSDNKMDTPIKVDDYFGGLSK